MQKEGSASFPPRSIQGVNLALSPKLLQTESAAARRNPESAFPSFTLPCVDDPRTDEALMLAYREGEARAFDALYARHRGGVFRYLLHHCGQRSQAEEMFQDVWMAVIRSRERYEVAAKFSTWLYRIARNRLIDAYRASGRAAELTVDARDEDGELPEAPAPIADRPDCRHERASLAARLAAEVGALPAPQREAFLLAAEGGLTVEEVARSTGVGFETAKSRLRYAYARLRKRLEDWR